MDDETLTKLLEIACPKPSFLASSNGGAVLSLALHCLMVDAGFVLASEAGRSADGGKRFQPQKDWNGVLVDQWIFEYVKPGKARKFILHCSLQARSRRMFVHCSEENNHANIQVLGLQLENYVPDSTALKQNAWRLTPSPSPSSSQAPAPSPSTDNGGSGAATSTSTNTSTTPTISDQPTPGSGPASALETAPGAAPAPAPATVVVNAAKMQGLLQEYIIGPLLANAEDTVGPPGPDTSEPELLPLRQRGGDRSLDWSASAWLDWLQGGGPGGLQQRRVVRLGGTAAAVVVVAVVVAAVAVRRAQPQHGAGGPRLRA